MRSRLLISVSAAALIAGAGLATAQDKGGPSGGSGSNPAAAPQTTSPAQQSAPPASNGGSEMQQRQEAPPVRAQQDNNRGEQKQQRAQDQREQRQERAQDQRDWRDNQAQDSKSDKKGSSATTGQGAGGASANLTTEQRSKISTNIRKTNVKRETNVNFNISVGTAIPRTVTLHPLPATVIEVYPQWRGYRFVLVEDEIVIIEPGSYRIVAVIDA